MRHLHALVPFLGTLLFSNTASASLQIVPGATWTASNGEHLNAHGGGVIRVNNGTYYLIGEDKSDGSAFVNVNCYSSRDLVQWTYEGALLSRTGSGDLGPNRIIERPKVIYNDKTGKYVLWMHVDSSSYGEAKVGVAVGDTVCGKYTYQRSFQPLGYQSRDMNLFKDDDGTAYLLSEDRANGLRIDKLTADYLDVAGATYLWKDHIEAPAMVKVNGRYYMFGSHLTGWDPNDNVYSTSTSLTSGWSSWAIFADKGSNTYASQTNYILNFGSSSSSSADTATDASNIMYLGDRWESSNLQSSTYIWLPLTISGTTVSLKNRASWVPNVGGTWSAAPSQTTYDATTGHYSGSARTVSCSACAGGSAAGYLGGPASASSTGGGNGSVAITGISGGNNGGGLTTVQIRYVNGDTAPRYAGVKVNGGGVKKVAFESTAGGKSTGTSVVHVQLENGSGNEVDVGGLNGGWAPDVDVVVVPVS